MVPGPPAVDGGPSARELALDAENRQLRAELDAVRGDNAALGALAKEYEAALDKVLDGLRVYAVSAAGGRAGGRAGGADGAGSTSTASRPSTSTRRTRTSSPTSAT